MGNPDNAGVSASSPDNASANGTPALYPVRSVSGLFGPNAFSAEPYWMTSAIEGLTLTGKPIDLTGTGFDDETVAGLLEEGGYVRFDPSSKDAWAIILVEDAVGDPAIATVTRSKPFSIEAIDPLLVPDALRVAVAEFYDQGDTAPNIDSLDNDANVPLIRLTPQGEGSVNFNITEAVHLDDTGRAVQAYIHSGGLFPDPASIGGDGIPYFVVVREDGAAWIAKMNGKTKVLPTGVPRLQDNLDRGDWIKFDPSSVADWSRLLTADKNAIGVATLADVRKDVSPHVLNDLQLLVGELPTSYAINPFDNSVYDLPALAQAAGWDKDGMPPVTGNESTKAHDLATAIFDAAIAAMTSGDHTALDDPYADVPVVASFRPTNYGANLGPQGKYHMDFLANGIVRWHSEDGTISPQDIQYPDTPEHVNFALDHAIRTMLKMVGEGEFELFDDKTGAKIETDPRHPFYFDWSPSTRTLTLTLGDGTGDVPQGTDLAIIEA